MDSEPHPGTKARSRCAMAAAWVAAVLGLGNAAVSLYWALGGTALLDTIGGELERWGRERSAAVVAGLWAVAGLKVGLAVAAPLLAGSGTSRTPAWVSSRWTRALGWLAATLMAVYGAVLTVVGLLVLHGPIEAAADVDRRALAWHSYLWDPWFLAWGLAWMASLRLSRERAGR